MKTKSINPFWKIAAVGLGLIALITATGCITEDDKEAEELFVVLSFQHYHDRQDENIIFLEARFQTKEIAQQVFDSPARAKYLAAAADMWAGMTQFSWYTVSGDRDILAEM